MKHRSGLVLITTVLLVTSGGLVLAPPGLAAVHAGTTSGNAQPATSSQPARHLGPAAARHTGTSAVPMSTAGTAHGTTPHHRLPVGYPKVDPGTHVPKPTAVDLAGMQPATTVWGGFQGMNGGETGGWDPPDTNAAVGLDDVVETANQSLAFYTRSGSRQYIAGLPYWFGASGSGIFDPHVIFDPRGQRYAILASDGTNWRLSVAQQTAAMGNWCNYVFPAVGASGQLADFPLLGADSRNFYLTVMDFAGSSLVDSRLLAVPRGQAESCQTVYPLLWTNIRDPGTSQLAYHVAPAVVYDDYDGYGWFADAYFNGGSHISVHYVDINNYLNSVQVSTIGYARPVPAKQAGTTATLDTGVPQFTGISKISGELYLSTVSSWDWGGGNVNATIAWMQVHAQAGNVHVDKQGSFGTPGYWYFYPASSGTPSVGAAQAFDYSVAGASVYPSNAVGTIDSAGNPTALYYDVQGTGPRTGALEPDCGSNCYRWGDFNSVVPDPTNNTTWWAAGEWSSSGNAWSTWMAQIGP